MSIREALEAIVRQQELLGKDKETDLICIYVEKALKELDVDVGDLKIDNVTGLIHPDDTVLIAIQSKNDTIYNKAIDDLNQRGLIRQLPHIEGLEDAVEDLRSHGFKHISYDSKATIKEAAQKYAALMAPSEGGE